jgi:putative membrane protein
MMMGWGMGFGLLFMLVFWGALIALVVGLVRALFPPAGQRPTPPTGRDLSAREILDRRFARGEISREEYDLMGATISSEIA